MVRQRQTNTMISRDDYIYREYMKAPGQYRPDLHTPLYPPNARFQSIFNTNDSAHSFIWCALCALFALCFFIFVPIGIKSIGPGIDTSNHQSYPKGILIYQNGAINEQTLKTIEKSRILHSERPSIKVMYGNGMRPYFAKQEYESVTMRICPSCTENEDSHKLEFDVFKNEIDLSFEELNKFMDDGGYIMIPTRDEIRNSRIKFYLGDGIGKLPDEYKKYLQERLDELGKHHARAIRWDLKKLEQM